MVYSLAFLYRRNQQINFFLCIFIIMRQICKQKIAKIPRLWNSRRKFRNRNRPINTIKGVKTLNSSMLNFPRKIINQQILNIDLPKKLQVSINSKRQITYTGQNMLFQMTFDQFLEYKGPLNLSVVQMEIFKYSVPEIVSQVLKTIRKVNLWIYTGKRITTWHYDGHDNFLFLKKGTKTFYLLPPNILRCKSSFSLSNNHIRQKSSMKKFYKKMFKVKLKKNECIYIPRGWWHYVISQGQQNIALNYWGNSIGEIKQGEYEIMMRHLIYQISQKICEKEVKSWQTLQQQIKQRYRSLYFAKFFAEKLS